MSTGATVAIVVVALIVLALIATLVMRGDGTGGVGSGARLKHRFGPEYDRVLERHDGDVKATRAELAERVKRHGDLELRPVSEQERERYTADWTALQARFVDEPVAAVGQADALIGEIAADRGFPAAQEPEHFDALSVHHPHAVHGYRQAHTLVDPVGAPGSAAPQKRQSTEDLRKALLGARGLFDELMTESARGTKNTTERADEAYEPVVEHDAAADEDAKAGGRRGALGGRFAALAGGRREHDDADERL
ncbi:hypothetical protein [Streptomyces sp. NPDC008139]|uniref:hypothetical protein n=1 Tax=Streptomyces sp. NPDC008139 TaxID=3364814 RepID=UPI0036F0615E